MPLRTRQNRDNDPFQYTNGYVLHTTTDHNKKMQNFMKAKNKNDNNFYY